MSLRSQWDTSERSIKTSERRGGALGKDQDHDLVVYKEKQVIDLESSASSWPFKL